MRGLPRIIPKVHRSRIRNGDLFVVRGWLTMFGLYRILEAPYKLKLKTITEPGPPLSGELLSEFSSFLQDHFLPILKKRFRGSFVKAIKQPLKFMASLRAKPFLISKSSPVKPGVEEVDNEQLSTVSTAPGAVLMAAVIWKNHSLYPTLESWCKMTGSIWILNRIDSWTKGKTLAPGSALVLGKLGLKFEPAGKVRVFAMVDCFTQWMMNPLHEAIFELLAQIPQDGTFDQLKPVESMIKRKLALGQTGLWSFDLSAATDRLPIVLQKVLLSPFLTSWGATLWANLLIGREYLFPGYGGERLPKMEPEMLVYARGQPMGALSSWAMLAFTHHAIVQWAAYRASGGQTQEGWFNNYAVLGDDIVIGDRAVAKQYLILMDALGVEISGHKSLQSPRRLVCEFAKRFFVGTKDASGVPLAQALVAQRNFSVLLETVRDYDLNLGRLMSLLGYGYRVKGSLSKRLWMLSPKVRNLLLSLYAPGGPWALSVDKFLRLRTKDSFYPAKGRWSKVMTNYMAASVRAVMERLDALDPILKEIASLVTVYRDREHYGTIPYAEQGARSAKTFRTQVLGAGDPFTIDSLRETVYRETFLGVGQRVREMREVCNKLLAQLQSDGLPYEEVIVTQAVRPMPERKEFSESGWASRVPVEPWNTEDWGPQPEWYGWRPCGPPDEHCVNSVTTNYIVPEVDGEMVSKVWDDLATVEAELGGLPLPKQLEYRVKVTLRSGVLKTVKRWYAFSKPFRSTK